MRKLNSGLDTGSAAFAANAALNRGLAEELRARSAKAALGGSAQSLVELRQKVGEAACKTGPRQHLHLADREKPKFVKNRRCLSAAAQPLDGQGS